MKVGIRIEHDPAVVSRAACQASPCIFVDVVSGYRCKSLSVRWRHLLPVAGRPCRGRCRPASGKETDESTVGSARASYLRLLIPRQVQRARDVARNDLEVARLIAGGRVRDARGRAVRGSYRKTNLHVIRPACSQARKPVRRLVVAERVCIGGAVWDVPPRTPWTHARLLESDTRLEPRVRGRRGSLRVPGQIQAPLP